MVLTFPSANSAAFADIEQGRRLSLGQAIPPHPLKHLPLEGRTAVTVFFAQSRHAMLSVGFQPLVYGGLIQAMLASYLPRTDVPT